MGRANAFAWLCLATVACEGDVEIRRRPGHEAPPPQAGEAAGGGSGGEPIGGEPGEGAASPGTRPECVAFCEAAAIRDCPKIDDCEGWCDVLFNGQCEPEIAAYLECSPSMLTVDCTVAYPDDWLGEQCITANDDLLMCDDTFCGSMQLEGTGDGGCVGDMHCSGNDLAIDCTPDGQCNCWWDEWLVGTCETIFSGFDGCVPNLSCCAVFFF